MSTKIQVPKTVADFHLKYLAGEGQIKFYHKEKKETKYIKLPYRYHIVGNSFSISGGGDGKSIFSNEVDDLSNYPI